MRFRQGEKSFYKTVNTTGRLRFPIPTTLTQTAHKVSIIIQSALGGTDLPSDENSKIIRHQFDMEKTLIFRHVCRFIRCIVDCKVSAGDAVAVQHALLLQRSFGASAWDDRPDQLRQIQGIGLAAARKLAVQKIYSIEDLESTESQRIDTILGRNQPFGRKLLETLKSFPKLHVSVHVVPNSIRTVSNGVQTRLKVEMGFMNEKLPSSWCNKKISVILLVSTSDGRLIHFSPMQAKHLGQPRDLSLTALMTSPDESINCHIMCDETGTYGASFHRIPTDPS